MIVFIFDKKPKKPKIVDIENPTVEELSSLEEYTNIKIDNDYLKNYKGWKATGDYDEIIDPDKGIEIIKNKKSYIAVWMPKERMIDNHKVKDKIKSLTDDGMIDGFICDNPIAELQKKGYEFVVRGIDS